MRAAVGGELDVISSGVMKWSLYFFFEDIVSDDDGFLWHLCDKFVDAADYRDDHWFDRFVIISEGFFLTSVKFHTDIERGQSQRQIYFWMDYLVKGITKNTKNEAIVVSISWINRWTQQNYLFISSKIASFFFHFHKMLIKFQLKKFTSTKGKYWQQANTHDDFFLPNILPIICPQNVMSLMAHKQGRKKWSQQIRTKS
jgi:hypothetical protein